MANLKTTDFRLLENILGMSSGYVLDFTNRTFSEFCKDEFDINIDDPRYHENGSSKANRLRTFIRIEPDLLVARVLGALWEYRKEGRTAVGANADVAARQQSHFLRLIDALGGKEPATRRDDCALSPPPNGPSLEAITGLNDRLFRLMKMESQERGFAFEKLLSDLFALHELDPRRSFRLVGEQIDGSFDLPPDTFLLEAKWQDRRLGQSELLAFAGKVDGKAQWSRGLFVSYGGFSDEGLEAFGRGRPTSIVCMDGLDLAHILSGRLSLVDVIWKKKQRAAETGRAFVPVRELFLSVT